MDAEYRAARAASLLGDELLTEVLASLEAEATAAWLATGAAQSNEREWAWMMAKTVARIRANLQSLVETPRMEAQRLVRPVA